MLRSTRDPYHRPMVEELDGRTPVIVGAGVVSQKFGRPGEGLEATALMAAAARAAAIDAGSGSLLPALERISVPSGSWSYSDPARLVAEAIGATGAKTVLVRLGHAQQRLLNEAFRDIRSGALDVALVCGGEAKWRATLAQRAGVPDVVTEQTDEQPDDLQIPTAEIITGPERAAGALSAVHQFALADNALRHAEGRTMAEQRDEIDSLWSRFNAVAVGYEHAAFRERRDAAFLGTPTDRNRPLAFPYFKWHASQWNVDQACGLIVTSLDAARAHGVDPERFVFPLLALESTFVSPMSARVELHRWPAMAILRDAAEAHLGRSLSSIDLAELYSCFPAAVRFQQRELGLALDGTPTVTGGMPFGGGPLNHYVLQSTAAIILRMREQQGSTALVATVSGMLAKPSLAVYGREPGVAPLLMQDYADEAREATRTVEVVPDYAGPATIATYTVTYDGLRPVSVVAIADTSDGRRCVTSAEDPVFAARATTEDVIGLPIDVHGPRSFMPRMSHPGCN